MGSLLSRRLGRADFNNTSTLASWTENADDGIKYFSGIATYYKEFELPGDLNTRNKLLMLDLGEVKFLADVYLNGSHIRILWHPLYRTDIYHAVKSGKNNLVVEIANTWSNRLTGDARLPESKRFTTTNIKHVGVPLKKGTTREDTSLLKSGLMGPVKIISAEKMTISVN